MIKAFLHTEISEFENGFALVFRVRLSDNSARSPHTSIDNFLIDMIVPVKGTEDLHSRIVNTSAPLQLRTANMVPGQNLKTLSAMYTRYERKLAELTRRFGEPEKSSAALTLMLAALDVDSIELSDPRLPGMNGTLESFSSENIGSSVHQAFYVAAIAVEKVIKEAVVS